MYEYLLIPETLFPLKITQDGGGEGTLPGVFSAKNPRTPKRWSSRAKVCCTGITCNLQPATCNLILHPEFCLHSSTHIRGLFAEEQYLLIEDELEALFFSNGLDGFVYLFVDGL